MSQEQKASQTFLPGRKSGANVVNSNYPSQSSLIIRRNKKAQKPTEPQVKEVILSRQAVQKKFMYDSVNSTELNFTGQERETMNVTPASLIQITKIGGGTRNSQGTFDGRFKKNHNFDFFDSKSGLMTGTNKGNPQASDRMGTLTQRETAVSGNPTISSKNLTKQFLKGHNQNSIEQGLPTGTTLTVRHAESSALNIHDSIGTLQKTRQKRGFITTERNTKMDDRLDFGGDSGEFPAENAKEGPFIHKLIKQKQIKNSLIVKEHIKSQQIKAALLDHERSFDNRKSNQQSDEMLFDENMAVEELRKLADKNINYIEGNDSKMASPTGKKILESNQMAEELIFIQKSNQEIIKRLRSNQRIIKLNHLKMSDKGKSEVPTPARGIIPEIDSSLDQQYPKFAQTADNSRLEGPPEGLNQLLRAPASNGSRFARSRPAHGLSQDYSQEEQTFIHYNSRKHIVKQSNMPLKRSLSPSLKDGNKTGFQPLTCTNESIARSMAWIPAPKVGTISGNPLDEARGSLRYSFTGKELQAQMQQQKRMHNSQTYKGRLKKLKQKAEAASKRVHTTSHDNETAFGFPTIHIQDPEQKKKKLAKAGCPGETTKNTLTGRQLKHTKMMENELLVSKNNPLQCSIKQYLFELNQTTNRGVQTPQDENDKPKRPPVPGKLAEDAQPNDFNRFYSDLKAISDDTDLLRYSGGARGNPQGFNEKKMLEKLKFFKNQIKQVAEELRFGVPPPVQEPNLVMGVKKKFGDELRQLGPNFYIVSADQEKWINKRTKLTESKAQQQLVERNNRALGKPQKEDDSDEQKTGKALQKQQIQIAKDLFLIWDGDGEGSLSPDELMKAFVRIGLSQDHHFAKNIMHSIRPQRKPKEGPDDESSQEEDEDIYLKDFIKIFRNDEVSDNLIKVINEEVNFRKAVAVTNERKKQEKRYEQEQKQREHKQFNLIIQNDNTIGGQMSIHGSLSEDHVIQEGDMESDHSYEIEMQQQKMLESMSGQQHTQEEDLSLEGDLSPQVSKTRGPSPTNLDTSKSSYILQDESPTMIHRDHLSNKRSSNVQRQVKITLSQETESQQVYQEIPATRIVLPYVQNSQTKSIQSNELLSPVSIGRKNNGCKKVSSQSRKLRKTTPTFGEQVEVVKYWWKQIIEIYVKEFNKYEAQGGNQKDVKRTKEVPLDKVYDFVIKKHIVRDRQSATKLVQQQIGGLQFLQNKNMMCFEEFNRLFCKAIFKTALIVTINKLQDQQKQQQKVVPSMPKKPISNTDINITNDSSSIGVPSPRAKQQSGNAFGSSMGSSPWKRSDKSPLSPVSNFSKVLNRDRLYFQFSKAESEQSPIEIPKVQLPKMAKDQSKGSLMLGLVKDSLRDQVIKRRDENIKLQEDAAQNFNKEMPLSLRIEKFQRQKLMLGLKPTRDNVQQESFKYLQSLKFIQKFEDEPDDLTKELRNRTYDQFMKDPFGYKQIEQMEMEKNLHKLDPFVENLKFIQHDSEADRGESKQNRRKPESSSDLDSDFKASEHGRKNTLSQFPNKNTSTTNFRKMSFTKVDKREPKKLNQVVPTVQEEEFKEIQDQIFLKKAMKQFQIDEKDLLTQKKDVELFHDNYISKTKEERLKDQCELLARMQTLMNQPKNP